MSRDLWDSSPVVDRLSLSVLSWQTNTLDSELPVSRNKIRFYSSSLPRVSPSQTRFGFSRWPNPLLFKEVYQPHSPPSPCPLLRGLHSTSVWLSKMWVLFLKPNLRHSFRSFVVSRKLIRLLYCLYIKSFYLLSGVNVFFHFLRINRMIYDFFWTILSRW